jgi:hypothetical protein
MHLWLKSKAPMISEVAVWLVVRKTCNLAGALKRINSGLSNRIGVFWEPYGPSRLVWLCAGSTPLR